MSGRTIEKWHDAQDYIKSNLAFEQSLRIEYRQCDVRVEQLVKNLLLDVFSQYRRLDVCVNAAGVRPGTTNKIWDFNFNSLIDPDDGSILFQLPAPQPYSPCIEDDSCPDINQQQKTSASFFAEDPIATTIFGTCYCLKWEISLGLSYQPINLPMSPF